MPNKPPTVLLLTSSYPRHKTDNSSIFLRYLAAHLADQGASVHVLAPDHHTVERTSLDKGVNNLWFKYLPKRWQTLAYGSGILPNLHKNPLLYLHVPFFLLSMFAHLLYLCWKIRPDVIHAHWIIPQGFIAVLAGKLFNIPVITTAHGGDAFSLNNGLLTRLKKFTLRHCHAWTSNTTVTAQAFGSTDQIPKPNIIPMGVDIQHFQSGNADNIKGDESRKIILFVGRLVEKKGVKYLIEAVSLLPSPIQEEAVLWIIGDGDERAALELQAKQLGITNIKFWGQVQNTQLADYYAAASLFVAPSVVDSKGDTEGQGVILLEAMASQTPIIASRIGGIPEVISNNESGLLVQPNDPEKLSNAIQQLFNKPQLRAALIRNASAKAEENYAWQAIANNFLAIYKNPTNRH